MKLSFIARLDSTFRLRIPKEVIAAKNPERRRYYNVTIEMIEEKEQSG